MSKPSIALLLGGAVGGWFINRALDQVLVPVEEDERSRRERRRQARRQSRRRGA